MADFDVTFRFSSRSNSEELPYETFAGQQGDAATFLSSQEAVQSPPDNVRDIGMTLQSGESGVMHVEMRSNAGSRSNSDQSSEMRSENIQTSISDGFEEMLKKIASDSYDNHFEFGQAADMSGHDFDFGQAAAGSVTESDDIFTLPDPDTHYADARTSSNRRYPSVSKFTITSVATVNGRLFPFARAVHGDRPWMDLAGLASHFRSFGGRGSAIVAVEASEELLSVAAKRPRADGGDAAQPVAAAVPKVLTAKLRLPSDQQDPRVAPRILEAKIWRSGTIQMTAAHSVAEASASFTAVRDWILAAAVAGAGLQPQDLAAAAADGGAEVESATFRGGWDCGFEAAGVQLDQDGLCRFLRDKHMERVSSARFSCEGRQARFSQARPAPPRPASTLSA